MNPSAVPRAASGAPSPSPSDLAAQRRQAVALAGMAWANAPAHVKALAGAYVGPLLDALSAVGRELDARGQS